ncbi:MAG: ABC transporter ATP-binding protein [Bradymonadales bacterium]|nr:ABC transporter ATP-binding protein [Bradymonadales bacterium]
MPGKPSPLIEVIDLHKVYGRAANACVALRGISTSIQAGEWVSIVGPSGSGKTTLLNILGALDARYQGTVRIDGHELKSLRDRALSTFRGQTIGFIFQHFNLLPHLSVVDNVMVPAFFSTQPHQEAKQRAWELLKRVGIKDKGTAQPNQLSGGQQQRVSIARALFNRTRILLCDEPTGALDQESGRQIMELFRSLNQADGITLVVVTHEPYIAQMAHRIIRLEDGRIVPADQPAHPASGYQKAAGEQDAELPSAQVPVP